MRVATLTLFLTLAAAVATQAAAGDRPIWTATCAAGGRTVYLERFLDRPSAAQEQEVSRRNPGAMCVFLAPEESVPMPLQEVLEGARVAPSAAAALPLTPKGQPVGIDAALRALRGESLPVAVPAAAPSPARAAPGVEIAEAPQPEAAPVPKPASPEWVRLSVYRGATQDDVLADWARISRGQPAFAPLSPSIYSGPGGELVLAAGPVLAGERNGVCVAAASMRLDCMPGEGKGAGEGRGAGAFGPALASLSMSYPGSFFLPRDAEESRRVPGVEQEAGLHGAALECPRSRLQLAAATEGVDLTALMRPRPEVLASDSALRQAVAVLPAQRRQKRPGPRRVKPASGASGSSRPLSISSRSSESAASAAVASSVSR